MLYYIVKNVIQSRNVFLFSLIIRLSNTSVFMRRIKLLFGKAVSSQNSKAAKASHQIFNSYNTLSCKKSTFKKALYRKRESFCAYLQNPFIAKRKRRRNPFLRRSLSHTERRLFSPFSKLLLSGLLLYQAISKRFIVFKAAAARALPAQ